MPSDARTGPGSTAVVPVEGGQPYHRLLRNPTMRWWTPVLGSFTILAGWLVASLIILTAQLMIREDTPGTVSWFGLLATNLSLTVFIPLCMLVARWLNHQPPGLLSSVTARLRWGPLAWFAAAAVVLEVLLLAVVHLAGVEVLGDGDGPARDAAAVIAVTLLTSTFQAAGEEYFFRGYLLQAVGSLVRNPVFAVVLTTIAFTMAHGVWPWESPALFLDRFAFGLVAGYLVIRTGGLEAAIAAHAANNVVTFIFAALTDSVGDSLQAGDAPWSLVALDVTKFGCFCLVAVLIARWQRLATTAPPELLRLQPTGAAGGRGGRPGKGLV